jgi:hypothetical protein
LQAATLHMPLRMIIKARGHFPSDEAALELISLALRNVVAKSTVLDMIGKAR